MNFAPLFDCFSTLSTRRRPSLSTSQRAKSSLLELVDELPLNIVDGSLTPLSNLTRGLSILLSVSSIEDSWCNPWKAERKGRKLEKGGGEAAEAGGEGDEVESKGGEVGQKVKREGGKVALLFLVKHGVLNL